jgi:prepilin-type processing-associated H-X9-DG protein
MKQIGLGWLQYVQDYDETVPMGNAHSFGQGWAGPIFPYIKANGVYFCPDDTTQATIATDTVVSYAMNANFVNFNSSYQPIVPVQLSNFGSTPLTVVLFEVRGFQTQTINAGTTTETASPVGGGTCAAEPNIGVYPAGSHLTMAGVIGLTCGSAAWGDVNGGVTGVPTAQIVSNRHSGAENYLLADGHVKWIRPELISTGVSNGSQGISWPSWPTTTNAMTVNGTTYTATFSVQ